MSVMPRVRWVRGLSQSGKIPDLRRSPALATQSGKTGMALLVAEPNMKTTR